MGPFRQLSYLGRAIRKESGIAQDEDEFLATAIMLVSVPAGILG